MTGLDDQLSETWGPAAQHSEYRRGDIVRYLVGLQSYVGTIVWIVGPGPSQIEGHPDQPLKYVISREGWEGFPDIALSSDIEGLSGPQEPVLVRCPWCQKFHYEGQVQYCPSNPSRPT